MRAFKISIALTLFLGGMAYAQECGPSCPVCSGNSEGALLARNSILFSVLTIPTAEEERAVINARYGIFRWLDAGVGYAARTEEFIWSVRTQPFEEKEGEWRPGLILGSGSVQTGGSDQSIYAQLTKSWEFGEDFAVRLMSGAAALVPEFDEVYGIAGVTTSIFERFGVIASYDGRSFHEGALWIPSEWFTVSFLMVESEYPAVSAAFKW